MKAAELVSKLRADADEMRRMGRHQMADDLREAARHLESVAGLLPDEDGKLICRLLAIAAVGIVNHRTDVQTLQDAAERIENLSERVAIMEEGGALAGMIAPGANIDLTKLLPDEGRTGSGLTEEE